MELLLIFLIALIPFTFFTVKQQTNVIVELFGKYWFTAKPGLNIKLPFISKKAGVVSLRVKELNVKVETKTKDDVFVDILVAVQYYVMPDKVVDAFYKLTSPEKQIESYVFDEVRAQVPTMELDDVFQNKEAIAASVKKGLDETMNQYGFAIVKALVNDINPDKKVKDAMNEINASRRLRIAAQEKGEGEKILVVKKAEADAESMRLQGEGIANQRMAIVNGLKESVEAFQKGIPGATPQDVMNMILLTQYFDTLKEVTGKSSTTTLLIPNSPNAVSDFANQIQEAVLRGNLITKNGK